MRCNSESIFFFCGTGHSPPCPELTSLSLSECWICSSCFSMQTAQTACGPAVTGLPWESALAAAGAVSLPWAQQGSAALFWPCSGPGGDNISAPAFAPWVPAAGTPSFALPNKASRAARWYWPLPAVTTQSHKWKNFCGKQPRLFYYLFLFLYNTPEHNLKLPLESTRPTVPFFLLGNTVYSDHPILLPLPGDLAEWMLMK